jgi:hypothetical protein
MIENMIETVEKCTRMTDTTKEILIEVMIIIENVMINTLQKSMTDMTTINHIGMITIVRMITSQNNTRAGEIII